MRDYGKIAVIGGDERMRWTAGALGEYGECAVWGLGEAPLPEKAVRCGCWQGAARGAGCVVLPLPATRDGETVSAPLAEDGAEPVPLDGLFDLMSAGTLLCGGMLSPLLRASAMERGAAVFDYYEDEAFQIANAVPTAEGAVAACMEALPGTVAGMRAVVAGYGRVGRILAGRLRSLGASVTVAARSARDRAWAAADGCAVLSLAEYAASPAHADAVFNTVPVTVFDKAALCRMDGDTVLFELAGGVDLEAARSAGIRVIPLPALPGKAAPKTAGEAIARAVLARLEKEGGFRG